MADYTRRPDRARGSGLGVRLGRAAAAAGLLLVLLVAGCQAAPTRPQVRILPAAPDWTSERSLEAEAVAFIDAAEDTLDCALYELSLASVSAALLRATQRGVRVRLHCESDSHPRLLHDADLTRDGKAAAMHHKFMVRDCAAVWTGSANLTWTGAFLHLNEALVLQDAALGRAYAERFEALRKGHDGPPPTTSGPIAACFRPADRRAAVLDFIDSAHTTLDVAAFSLTDDAIVDHLIAAARRGVRVRIALDTGQSRGRAGAAALRRLEGAGLRPALSAVHPHPDLLARFTLPRAQDAKLHHKLMRADDTRVLTGSANFSAGGLDRNDEDVLTIDDPAVARAYDPVLEKVRRATR